MVTISYDEIANMAGGVPVPRRNRYWNTAPTFRAIWGAGDIPMTVEALKLGIEPRGRRHNHHNQAYGVDSFGDRFDFDVLAEFVIPEANWTKYCAAFNRSRDAYLSSLADARIGSRAYLESVFGIPGFRVLRQAEWKRYYGEVHGAYDDHRRDIIAAIAEYAGDEGSADPIEPTEPIVRARWVYPTRTRRIRR